MIFSAKPAFVIQTVCRILFLSLCLAAALIYFDLWQDAARQEWIGIIDLFIIPPLGFCIYVIAKVCWIWGFEDTSYARITLWIGRLTILLPICSVVWVLWPWIRFAVAH
jgi:cytochrome bd-type quinol oxidase subunit 2